MLYRPPHVDEQPSVKLAAWQAYRIADGNTVHFVGRVIGEKGRVSSPVVSFDPETMTGVTRAGRRYELVGPPGTETVNRVRESFPADPEALSEVLYRHSLRSRPVAMRA